MVRRNKPGILVLILGIIVVTAVFFEADLLGSSDQIGEEVKDGFENECRIFVKGDHAYVMRIDLLALPPPDGYLSIFNVGVVGDRIEDTTFTEPCFSESIPNASDVFVSGEYLYVGGRYGFDSCVLRRYDISESCDPVFVDSDTGHLTHGGGTFSWLTDMYITGDRAYLSIDARNVVVFEVSDTLLEWLGTIESDYSPQGVHVRGSYMYVGNESGGLWVRDLSNGSNYQAPPHTNASRDAYNVVCSGKSRTYEVTTHDFPDRLYVWDTDDLNNMGLVGSISTSGHVLHITGNCVYWLRVNGSVNVCSLVCDGNPQLAAQYGSNLHDFHVVHDGTGHAHIYGAYPDTTDTGVVIRYFEAANHTINPYLYGDVNGDWKVDTADVSILDRYVLAGDTCPVNNLDGCDVNCDGEVNTDDYYYLSNYLFGNGPGPGADCWFYDSIYVYGDANHDDEVDVADVVYLINYLFGGGPDPKPMTAGDPNGDCVVDVADVVYLINYLFTEGPPPQQGCAE